MLARQQLPASDSASQGGSSGIKKYVQPPQAELTQLCDSTGRQAVRSSLVQDSPSLWVRREEGAHRSRRGLSW